MSSSASWRTHSVPVETTDLFAALARTLIWDRIRHPQRLRAGGRKDHPASPVAFEDLASSDALEAMDKAFDPIAAPVCRAPRLSLV